MPGGTTLDPSTWRVERRNDGALVVRVRSSGRDGMRVPDAVFAFRSGDPQYCYWEEQFRAQQGRRG